ncbi:LuxE/PaaK family acyltransferase [Clostridium brassicae]|uniref:Acyl-protein synthetase n=1 Tax=Clostridium brassicae TaxID=2999072 RepID=A0ABT4DHM9_9CLOT|nr:acyl-protein synthetase [Clostridium brassicae]MCY6960601.1 acyl-protein synthetase [Clostridium brassicae]
MDKDNFVDDIILGEQFKIAQNEKESMLVGVIKPQLKNNMKNLNIKSLYTKMSVDIDNIKTLEEVPYIPVNMFKNFDLKTCTDEEVIRILNSSATTTGMPSKIYLDKKTSIRQSQGLISTLKNFLGGKRRPMLVIDSEDINKKSSTMTARGAAVRGVSVFASKTVYVMDNHNGNLEINVDRLLEFQKKYKDQEVLIYGFTYIVWSKFVNILKQKGIKIDLPKAKLLHSGGWKKLISEKVEKKEFSKSAAEVLNTSPNNIIDFYGMVEQVGVVFIDCECGYKHVPDFAEVIIRDIVSLEEVNVGESGLIEVMSTLGSSYPSQAILTEDIGELVGIDDCKCGRKGKYFKFKSRVEKAEIRGCGDTFAEREKRK